MQIFKTYAESYPEVLDQRVVDLCLVGKYWNAVANSTPQLWTEINLFFPFPDQHLAAALKRVRASRLQKIDVSIDFRNPDWDGIDRDEDTYVPGGHAWVIGIMEVLKRTEGRWRSIKAVSDTWVPLYELMHDWRRFTHLPSLESISISRADHRLCLRGVSFSPRRLMEKKTLFGQNAVLPKLREVSLYGVHVDWNNASVCQNLRKLEITNQTHDVGPSFEEFAAMLSSSPRLECLNIFGFCPEYHTVPALPAGGPPEIPVVHLPVLEEFYFGWKDVNLSCTFLRMFQIGDSLETLVLLDTQSAFDYLPDPQTGVRDWKQESQEIFEVLCELGSAVPKDKDDTPSGPFISVRGVKELRIICTKASRSSLVPFLETLTELEGLWLEDIDENITEDVMVWFDSRDKRRSVLRGLYFQWRWHQRAPAFTLPLFDRLKRGGDALVTRRVEQLVWQDCHDSPWEGLEG